MNPQDPFRQQSQNNQPQQGGFDVPQGGQYAQPEPLYNAAPGAPVQQPQPQASATQPSYQQMQPAGQSPYVVPPKPAKHWMIIGIAAIVVAVLLAAGFVWAVLQYIDQRDNTDSKVTAAVSEAVKTQADKDAAAFLEQEKEPNRLFVGPDDYGRLSFKYPKTWSTYIAEDALKGGAYEAYLNPVVVPPVDVSTQQFALRILIEEKDYDKVLDTYKEKVRKSELVSSPVKADDQNGTRFDGMFTKDIKGSAVVFKIRDKTVTIRTDAEVFRADFDALIQTITFNK